MASLKLSLELFDERVIDYAVTAFSRLATIRTEVMGEYSYCVFTDCALDPCLTAMEFENYVIDAANGLTL